MINKRKLDELIKIVTWDPEKQCGYTFKECCDNRDYQIHVCRFVNESWMPGLLAGYLYEDCYYEDIETVKANLDYINISMKKTFFCKDWAEIPINTILEYIEYEKEAAEKEAKLTGDSYNDDLGELLDEATEKCE